MRDFATVEGDGAIDGPTAVAARRQMDIDELGLDELDRSVLRAIIELYGGGPVGLDTLAANLGEESVTLEDVCEPYLMQMGMLTRTPRGRCVTRLAYEHLNMPVPKHLRAEDADEVDGQQSSKIAGLFDGRAGGNADLHAHLLRHNAGQRCFAKPAGRTAEYGPSVPRAAGRRAGNAQIVFGLS